MLRGIFRRTQPRIQKAAIATIRREQPRIQEAAFDEVEEQEEASMQGLPAVPEVPFNAGIAIDKVTATQDVAATQGVAAIQEVAGIDGNPSILHIFPVICTPTPEEIIYKFGLYDAATADVNFQFTINGRTTLVPAHKCLLAHQSAVFRQMFFGTMIDDVNIITQVKIIEALPDEFIEFAKWFYYEKTEITEINVSAMTYLTHKYSVEMFELECKTFLARMVNSNKVSIFWVLPMTILYNYDDLRQKCVDFIHWNGQFLIELLKFANCSLETLKSVLSIDFNNRDEAIVFEKCISWAKKSCEQKDLDPTLRQNIRNQLGDCLELIRFERMSPSQFTQCLSKHSYVFLTDEIGNIAQTIEGQDREFGTVVVPPVIEVHGVGQMFKPSLRDIMFDVDTADVFFVFESSPGKDEKRIAAHKCILSANSSIFKNELMALKKSYTFHITDASYEDYSTFIKILYGFATLLKYHTHLSNESIDKVLVLVKRYNVHSRYRNLSAIDCIEDELIAMQNDENLFWLFELSRIHSLHFLHYLCIDRIESGQGIFLSDSFLNLCQESFKSIFSFVLNKCDAATCCEAGLKWAEAFCERNQLENSGENIRMALGDFWLMKPFSGLEPVEFIRYRRDLGNIFTSEQICKIIDTMANEYEADQSEDDANMNESNGEIVESDYESSLEDDSISEGELDDSISEGELKYLKSDL